MGWWEYFFRSRPLAKAQAESEDARGADASLISYRARSRLAGPAHKAAAVPRGEADRLRAPK
eukprot:2271219-Pyramimonas_sp.AAC.1